MGKIKTLIVILITLFFSITTVSAACTVEETNRLNSLAINVKASYEIMEGILDKDEYTPPDGMSFEEAENYVATYTFFRIYINNLTEDLYIKVHNDVTNVTKTYTYEDSENGTIAIDWESIRAIVNYTISVYSSDKTKCPDSKLYNLYITTPRFNIYSTYDLCKGNEGFYLCHQYLSIGDVSFDNFIKSINKYKKGVLNDNGEEIVDNNQNDDGFINFINDNKTLIICVSITIILIIGMIVIVVIKKQRSKKI